MAPFASKSQQRFLFSQKPSVAREFASETSHAQFKKLPERKKDLNRRIKDAK